MNDRELLELAAKAAGYEFFEAFGSGGNPAIRIDGKDCLWNPLTDDGDALRLVVELRLDLNCYNESDETSACLYDNGITHRRIEKFGDNPYAATRRAIVRAAADIGKHK